MKKRLISLLVSGTLALALAVSGGCCHYSSHSDRRCGGKQTRCDKTAGCDKMAGGDKRYDKPCCATAPVEGSKVVPK